VSEGGDDDLSAAPTAATADSLLRRIIVVEPPPLATGSRFGRYTVLRKLGPDIQWVHSYVTDDKIYCIYRAPSEDIIREHARTAGFPANSISRVQNVISPVTAE